GGPTALRILDRPRRRLVSCSRLQSAKHSARKRAAKSGISTGSLAVHRNVLAYGSSTSVSNVLLHLLADEIEALPLEGATEALSWVGDQIERLLREADRILRAQAGRRET